MKKVAGECEVQFDVSPTLEDTSALFDKKKFEKKN